MKHLIKYEFKKNLLGLIIWGALVTGLVVLVCSILYPVLKDEITKMTGVPMISAYGTPEGWFSGEVYGSVSLLGLLYAALLGGGILATNFKDGSAASIYALPLSRSQIALSKWFIVKINIFLFNVVVFIFSLISLIFLPVSVGALAVYYLINTLLMTFIAGIMFSLCLISKKFHSVGACIGIAFLLYIVSAILAMIAGVLDAEFLNALTPFGILDINYLFTNLGKTFNLIAALIWLVIGVALFIIGLKKYKEKDIV